jgi:protein phosphatase
LDRIALISDIHGNLPALEAVLDDIRARGIERIFCLGDLVGKGPHSAEAVDSCRSVCEVTVRGNWDDFILKDSEVPALQWHRRRLGPERLRYLGSLPGSHDLVMSGKRVRLFHASQLGIYHRVRMNDAPEHHLAMFTSTEFTGDGPEPDVVGYGDIHSAFVKSFRQRILFNVGSVGNPLDVTQASYGILEGAYEGQAPSGFAVQLVRVPYDIELAISQARAEGMPELEAYADELRTGRYRGLKPGA